MSIWRPVQWVTLGAGAMALLIFGGKLLFKANVPQAFIAETLPTSSGSLDRLDAATLDRLGVRTAAPAAATIRNHAEGFARGLDASPLAVLVAEIDAATATAEASQAEAERLDALYQQDVSASRRAVESAQALARSDAARLRLAEQRIGLEFGEGLMRLGKVGVRELVKQIAWGKAALVRIDIAGVTLAPEVLVEIGEPESSMSARILGTAAVADVRLQSTGALAIVREPLSRKLQSGKILAARVATGTPIAGVLIPREAVVRYQGRLWVYRKEATAFRRIALDDPQPTAEGWTVRTGIAPGDSIAISGATGLLAIDTGGDTAGMEHGE